jgi:hypothetical protein
MIPEIEERFKATMSLPTPYTSDELTYLTMVLTTKEENDDKDNVQLAFYRELMKTDPKWVQSQKQKAEEAFRRETAEWRRECAAEAKAEQQAKAEKKKSGRDAGTERCLAKLDKLITELTGAAS